MDKYNSKSCNQFIPNRDYEKSEIKLQGWNNKNYFDFKSPLNKQINFSKSKDFSTFEQLDQSDDLFEELHQSTLVFDQERNNTNDGDFHNKYDPGKFYDDISVNLQPENRIPFSMKMNPQKLETGSIIRDFIKLKQSPF